MQEEVHTVLSHSQLQEVQKNPYKCLVQNLKYPSSITMEVSNSQYVLQKVILQHQRVDLFAYAVMVGIQPAPHRSTLHTMFTLLQKMDFFLCFSSDTQKRTNTFLLGISRSKLPAFRQHYLHSKVTCFQDMPELLCMHSCFTQHFPEGL